MTEMYMSTHAAEIQTVQYVSDISRAQKTRYYKVDHMSLMPDSASVHTVTSLPDRYDNAYTIHVYSVIPVKAGTDTLNTYWICNSYDKKIDYKNDKTYLDNATNDFRNECIYTLKTYDYTTADHFDTHIFSHFRDNCFEAIKTRFKFHDNSHIVLLLPVTDSYDKRDGRTLIWLCKILGVGFGLVFLLLLFYGYQPPKNKRPIHL